MHPRGTPFQFIRTKFIKEFNLTLYNSLTTSTFIRYKFYITKTIDPRGTVHCSHFVMAIFC